MKVMLEFAPSKNLEISDVLVFKGDRWTNVSKNEYLAELNKEIKELKFGNAVLDSSIKSLRLEVENLFPRDLFITKSIYDNYIERGLIDENNEFDEKFYNFVFNDYELKEEDMDSDFIRILEKVRLDQWIKRKLF